MRSIACWLRPTSLRGLTFGLRYVGTLSNGRRVYSNLAVVSRGPDKIEFDGGAAAETHSVGSGRVPGKVVTTWRTGIRGHFQSIAF